MNLETLRFNDFSEAERSAGVVDAEAMRQRVGNNLVNLELKLNSRSRSGIEMDMLDLSGVSVTWHTSHGISMTRDARHLVDAADDVTITLPSLGSFDASQDGRGATVEVGSAVALRANRASKVELGGRCEFIGLRLSHHLWPDRLREWARAGSSVDGPQMFDTCQPVFVLLRSYLFGLRNVRKALTLHEAELARSQITALLTEALMPSRQTCRQSPQLDPAAIRQAALDLMQRHHEDATLSVADVAGWMGIDSCSVETSFLRNGTSFDDELLQIRIGHIGRSLRDPAQAQGKLSHLAIRHGIDDLGEFIAGFEALFGTDPETYRRLLPG